MSRWPNKYVIGLTGNIAVGKSVVRQMLQHLGAYTIDADGLAHQAMAPGAPAYKPVVDTFGQFILDADGRINRAMLGSIVFSNPAALAKLEAITHPIIGAAINTLISRATQRVVVVEAIKVFEGSLAGALDAVWVVNAPPEVQLKRLVEKRKMSEADAKQRIAAQNLQSDKLKKASVVIDDGGNVEDTWKQVQIAWNEVQKALSGAAPAAPAPPAAKPAAPPAPTPKPAAVPTPKPAAAPPPAPPAKPAAAPAQPTAAVKPAAPPAPAASKPAAAAPPAPAKPAAAPAQPAAVAKPSAPPAPAVSAGQQAEKEGIALAPPPPPGSGIEVRRGMPGNAAQIAEFVTKMSGKNVSRMDVMMEFGQKSYLLAVNQSETVVGLMGWQVENLITRVDEFYLDSSAPKDIVIQGLVHAVEMASKDLQSEVGFIFLPANLPQDTIQGFVKNGYDVTTVTDIKIPAWREAVQEIASAGMQILRKQLRKDRVLKPI